MSYRSNHSVGAMHPILFFVIVYGIALFMAFFICNTVYSNWQKAGPGIAAGRAAVYDIARSDMHEPAP